MTNAEQLKAIITALGGSPTGNTNKELLNQIADLLGASAEGSSNADVLAIISGVADDVVIGSPQTKNVTPAITAKNVTADSGKYLQKVVVAAVTSSIDANIVADNIKSGVTILGVTGTYTGEPAAEPDTEPSE